MRCTGKVSLGFRVTFLHPPCGATTREFWLRHGDTYSCDFSGSLRGIRIVESLETTRDPDDSPSSSLIVFLLSLFLSSSTLPRPSLRSFLFLFLLRYDVCTRTTTTSWIGPSSSPARIIPQNAARMQGVSRGYPRRLSPPGRTSVSRSHRDAYRYAFSVGTAERTKK